MRSLTPDQIIERERIIADKCNVIVPLHEAFYLEAINYAASRALNAFDRYDKLLSGKGSAEEVFSCIQEALAHAGALSRFFWPVRKNGAQTAARGQRLREPFGLKDTSPLKWRRLRNAMEHFDEDLDRFLLSDPVGYMFPTPIDDDVELARESNGHVFKLLDPQRGICVLLNEEFEYQPIFHEVQDVKARADIMRNHGGRLSA